MVRMRYSFSKYAGASERVKNIMERSLTMREERIQECFER